MKQQNVPDFIPLKRFSSLNYNKFMILSHDIVHYFCGFLDISIS